MLLSRAPLSNRGQGKRKGWWSKPPLYRACFKKNSSLHIWPKNFRTTSFYEFYPKIYNFYPSKILMTFFSVITSFYDFLALRMFLNPKCSPHKFLGDLFLSLSLSKFWWPFFSHHPFLRFSVLPNFHILHMMNPIPIFCALYTPYIVYTPTCCFHVSTPFFVLS